MLTKEEKHLFAAKTCIHDKDTGSSAVQISILTEKINRLNDHLNTNHKDKHSRRGLVGMVEDRRKHLSYLRENHKELYQKTIATLGLKK